MNWLSNAHKFSYTQIHPTVSIKALTIYHNNSNQMYFRDTPIAISQLQLSYLRSQFLLADAIIGWTQPRLSMKIQDKIEASLKTTAFSQPLSKVPIGRMVTKWISVRENGTCGLPVRGLNSKPTQNDWTSGLLHFGKFPFVNCLHRLSLCMEWIKFLRPSRFRVERASYFSAMLLWRWVDESLNGSVAHCEMRMCLHASLFFSSSSHSIG
jgi:hypothetical protein